MKQNNNNNIKEIPQESLYTEDTVPIIAYCRESKEEQASEGASLEAQKNSAKALAKKLNVVLPEENIMIDILSASKNRLQDRPALQRVLEYVKKYKPKFLIVWKRDRLARNTYEYNNILNELKKNGTELVFTSMEEPPLGKGIFGGFQETLFMSFSELESQIIGQRIRDTRKSLLETNQLVIGTPPYGYAYNPSKRGYDIISEQADVILRIFRMYTEENLGFSKIAISLNEENIPSQKRGTWSSSTIGRIIQNPFYTGCQRATYFCEDTKTRKTVIFRQEKITPIINKDLFCKAQKLLESKKTYNIPPREYTTTFYFSGLVQCGNCGSKFINRYSSEFSSTGKRLTYNNYRCSGFSNGISCACSISKSKLENAVISKLFEELKKINADHILKEAESQLKLELQSLYNNKSSLEKDQINIEKKVNFNQERLEKTTSDRLQTHYENRIIFLQEEMDLNNRDLIAIEKEIDDLESVSIEKVKLLNSINNYQDIFEKSNDEVKRGMILDVIEQIIYFPKERTAKILLKLNNNILNSCGLYTDSDSCSYKDHGIGRISFETKIA